MEEVSKHPLVKFADDMTGRDQPLAQGQAEVQMGLERLQEWGVKAVRTNAKL